MSAPATKRHDDPVVVTPATHKAVFDNERVRVLDIRVKPGAAVPMHSHPGYVFYALTPFKVRFTYPGGKSEVVEGGPGAVGWRDAEAHAAVNLGNDEIHLLNFEVK